MVVDQFQSQNENRTQESTHAADHLHAMVTSWALGLSVGTAMLLVAGASSLVRRVIRPVLAVTDAAGAFGQGRVSARAPILYDDEMGALARTFDNMAGDIADREKDRLQFVAMVVHDLKNPILAIEMATRLLEQPGVVEDERRRYLAGIQEETGQLRTIVRDLTDDVQVANGRFSVQKTQVDLGGLVRRFVETHGTTFQIRLLLARVVVQA
ncbi:MAG: HAMP domain-containing protein [Planctomycetes bacterium]|nr:HAMP domain-containing protein [Planctomycetota bacterium]